MSPLDYSTQLKTLNKKGYSQPRGPTGPILLKITDFRNNLERLSLVSLSSQV